MYYSVICTSCAHTISIETRSFELAYPLDYENRIKKFFSDNCRKCGETTHMEPMNVRARKIEEEVFKR